MPPARIAIRGADNAEEEADTAQGGGGAASSNGDHQTPQPMDMDALQLEERAALQQWARDLADAAASAAGKDLVRRLLDEWFAQPQEPAVVGVPDDLLARAADTSSRTPDRLSHSFAT